MMDVGERDRQILRKIGANSDVRRYSSDTIDRLRANRLIYTVEDNEKGTLHAHLSDRGRKACHGSV